MGRTEFTIDPQLLGGGGTSSTMVSKSSEIHRNPMQRFRVGSQKLQVQCIQWNSLVIKPQEIAGSLSLKTSDHRKFPVLNHNFHSEVLDVSAAKWLMPSKRGVEKRNKARDNKKRRSKEPVVPTTAITMTPWHPCMIYLTTFTRKTKKNKCK